jgi:hypothetical protein
MKPGRFRCCCRFGSECDGSGTIECDGCGGDHCVCACGGASACPGCPACEVGIFDDCDPLGDCEREGMAEP